MIKSIKLCLLFFTSFLFLNFGVNAGGHYTGPDLSGQKVTMFAPWLAPEDATMREVMDIFAKATGAEVEYGGSDSFEQQVMIDLKAGSAADLVVFPQPGLAANAAAMGGLAPMGDDLKQLVLDNYVIASGSASGTYTETTQIVLPADAALGEHTMRVKTNWNAGVPDDSCEETTYGETEDYMVNVVTSLSIGDLEFNGSNMIVYSNDNENFTVKLTTDYSDLMTISVYDTRGRILESRDITKTNNLSYVYNLNMSNAEAGIYFIRLGNSTVGYKTERIIVR